jgi:hypothetical protein
MIRASFSPLFVLAVCFAGCGPSIDFKTVPAGGTVLLDGVAVEGAGVSFLSKEGNRIAEGTTDASGNFSLKTVVGKTLLEGAVVGVHKVAVVKTESSGKGAEGAEKKAGETDREMVARMAGKATDTSDVKQKYIVPKKYTNFDNSGLTATVAEGGSKDIKIELSSKAK